jgi:hypothetical protein
VGIKPSQRLYGKSPYLNGEQEEMGRNTKYTEAMATEICERLAGGESLRSICNDENMPDERRVREWASDPTHPISPRYARAREVGYMLMADELLEISDSKTGEDDAATVQRDRLRVDTRKWLLSKMLPKVFGEKITNEVTGSLTVRETVDKPPTETREEWIARRARELGVNSAVGATAGTTNGRHHS